jgi:alpha-tubulin suppressor-like RCC1 family protein
MTATVSAQDDTYVIEISAGEAFSLAIKSDGTLWVWGSNNFGQLGDGGTTPLRTTPAKIMTDARAISAGNSHSLAIRRDGSLWAWGNNDSGQLGDGTITTYDENGIVIEDNDKLVPIKIMDGVTAISAGYNYSLATRSNGASLWAWGSNEFGQLGNGTETGSTTPVRVEVDEWTNDRITAISAGINHSLAISRLVRADGSLGPGSLWAWGSNEFGQLGDGTEINKSAPVRIMSDVIAISAGDDHSLAIRGDGSLWAWGSNEFGQLGDGSTISRTEPVRIMGDVTAISAGEAFSLAIRRDGSLWAWGWNGGEQLGDGTTTDRITPVKIMDDVTAISAGYSHSLAIRRDGTLWAWGNNMVGQLGDRTRASGAMPVKIMEGRPLRQPSSYLGNVLYTDITTYIDGYAIPAYNIAGNTYVVAEDLMRYNFDVTWNGTARTLSIQDWTGKPGYNPIAIPAATGRPGTVRMNYFRTDIKTFIEGVEVEGFNVGGQTLIHFDLLSRYGTVTWDGAARELRLDRPAR